MKRRLSQITATTFVVGLICLLCSGCGNTIEPKKCAYCKGAIYYHNSNNGFMQGQFQQQWEEADGKYYHSWCIKISRLEAKMDRLKDKKE